jgi:UDP-N-acetylglucosamine 2-epimerase (non-hydrolysing)
MAPVIHALRRHRGELETRLVLTGQHDELVDEVLLTFGLEPDWDLEIMTEGQSLSHVGSACLAGVTDVLKAWPPDLVLVEGDTASVFFGAMAAYLHGVPVGHVEAGLRTGNLWSPFPEEGFRRLVADLTELHFVPTPRARENLLKEGVSSAKIFLTGNPVVDALLSVADRHEEPESPVLRRLVAEGAPPFVLLTAHRRESFGRPLEEIFDGILELLNRDEVLEVVYPVHPNPAVVVPAQRILSGHPRIHLIGPLRYADLVSALSAASCVLTDSGGIQEEAPTFGTPVLILRDVTERPEGIEAGVARLVGTKPDRIVKEAQAVLLGDGRDRVVLRLANPYGDGRAGEKRADVVAAFLCEDQEHPPPGRDS